MLRIRPLAALAAAAISISTPLIWNGVAAAGPPTWHLTKVIGPSSVGEMTGVRCVSTTHCVATNFGGYIYATGNSWTSFHRVLGFSTHNADDMNGVDCLSATTCVAVGGWGTSTNAYGIIDRTTNGGASWVAEHTSTTWPLWSVSCPTSTVCYAAGDRDGHTAYWLKSTNAGVTWVAHVGIDPSIGVLDGISCNDATFCAVTGSIATAANTLSGGSRWTDAIIPSNVRYLTGISCQLSTDCEAVGSSFSGKGIALHSNDGGLKWTQMTTPSSVSKLYAVTCLTSNDCFAVGRTGTTDEDGHGVVLNSTNATSFSSMTLPAGSSALLGISCVSLTHCTAVGENKLSEDVVLTFN
jgi:hypothetical protein